MVKKLPGLNFQRNKPEKNGNVTYFTNQTLVLKKLSLFSLMNLICVCIKKNFKQTRNIYCPATHMPCHTYEFIPFNRLDSTKHYHLKLPILCTGLTTKQWDSSSVTQHKPCSCVFKHWVIMTGKFCTWGSLNLAHRASWEAADGIKYFQSGFGGSQFEKHCIQTSHGHLIFNMLEMSLQIME